MSLKMAGVKTVSSAVLSCWLFAGAVLAAPPWLSLVTRDRVEADPSKDYQLTEGNGPWTILACTFSGDGAEEQAHELVLELRRRYKLPAYTHRMHFDLEAAEGRGLNRLGGAVQMRYRRGNTVDEIAVLVGDYPTVDDPEAQRTLKRLKQSTPECLEVSESRPTARNLAGWRALASQLNRDPDSAGPLSKAFVTTNPLLPREYFAPKGVEPEVLEWNAGVKHSLLDCPGRYTVQVATFKGRTLIKQDEIEAVERGDQALNSSLADAADKANRLCLALRMMGYDAYQFHDRYASIVTVGSFDSVGTPRPDGKMEINPAIHGLMQKFASQPANIPGQPPGAMALKTIVGIPLDIQPLPVEVPKRSISAALSGQTALW
ncbi:MAG: hypothetical protein RBS80_17935 [Thermoguttaceae bacterium]|jgi:hypothetical protein|nr:hypothetical protein [Thermoguttaceae bacterium]